LQALKIFLELSAFSLNAMRFALCAKLQGRANFFMDDTNISDKVNPSTPRPEGLGLLGVDPERRFFTPP
jgi:hypothetical protein